ncbi:MAG: NADH-quinone oxidoreductase subunit H [Candidatus Hydrogenedentes bacterium]|nr:NADH-quinone oxidoreductase subunit H [Candidatus Hydrogenedentota bacterium]
MDEFVRSFESGAMRTLWPALEHMPAWVPFAVVYTLGGLFFAAWMGLMALVWTYGERRIAGFIQVRFGPDRVGPVGILQPLTDGIKLLAKEDIIPRAAHRLLFEAAPLLVFLGVMIPYAVLPFSERFVLSNMDVALYYVLAFEAIEVIGVLMAGWASGSKWSLYGGVRLVAQMLSYEIPVGLCVLVVVLLAGSLNLGEIVQWQTHDAFGLEHPWILGWTVFRSPAAFIAFIVFYVAGLASTKRAPFDLPEAESELVAGYHTEYSGIRFSFFFMSEYAAMYVMSALTAILFLGGWHGPIPRPDVPEGLTFLSLWSQAMSGGISGVDSFLDKVFLFVASGFGALFSGQGLRIAASETIGVVNMVGKAFLLYFVMIWVRWTLPRIRIDQVMYLCLKVFLPVSLLCVLWAMIQVVVFS